MYVCVLQACVHVYSSAKINSQFSATLLGIESLLEVRTKLREARLAWFNLGLVLGLLQHTLESIHDIGHCLTETLAAWLQGRDGAAAPTWRAIVEALLSPTINFYRLALQISNSHQSNDSRSLMAGNEDPALQDIDNAKLGKPLNFVDTPADIIIQSVFVTI